ncbi:hypothetical protein DPMN_005626 [Dreissena polymorpha]|uniref:Uncharacterized protein n=1 Tax=Dreissena polymorpha TaxID=45954 RepID=A0A9D4RUP9_DREPO|nr:hypothetical protein DPMN_005626 [Dreissena polymorpha]
MRPKRGPLPSTNPLASLKLLTTAFVRLLASASVKLPASVSVKLLATASVKLLAFAKPLALRHHKALGEATVTALYDVRRFQPSEEPLTIQQELRSSSSTGNYRRFRILPHSTEITDQHLSFTNFIFFLLLHYFLSSAPGLSPIWPSPPERRVSWLRGIVQDTGDTPFQR